LEALEEGKKCGLYSQSLHFHFYILIVMKFSCIGYSVFLYTFFLCIQEQQRAPSPPISLIRGNGDVAATPISRGDVPISDASQQAHDIGTQVLLDTSSIFSSNCGRQ
jgi:hypothetical protein